MEKTDLIRISLSLALIVGLIFISAWITKRSGLLRSKRLQRIEVLSNQRIGPRNHLLLVQVGTQQLLLGVTPQHINTLHLFVNNTEVGNLDSAASSDQAPCDANFKKILQRKQQEQPL